MRRRFAVIPIVALANLAVGMHASSPAPADAAEPARAELTGIDTGKPEATDAVRNHNGYCGLRYYAPNKGRWVKRDSISERGGINLYVFVVNSPLNLCDPLGNAYAVYSPDPLVGAPYAYEDLEDTPGFMTLGEVRHTYRVDCLCSCGGCGGYQMHCRVEFGSEIILDIWYRTHNEHGDKTKQGTYGHEQRHIISHRNHIDRDVLPYLNEKESQCFQFESVCGIAAGIAQQHAEFMIFIYKGSEDSHGNDDSPRKGIDYPPIEGIMP